MTIKEAFEKGLIKVGTRIRTNANYDGVEDSESYSGIVNGINGTIIALERDDGVLGGVDGYWGIYTYNTKAYVEMIKERLTVTVMDAFNKGLIKVGVRVETNASAFSISFGGNFTGVIAFVCQDSFDIKRDDGKGGAGINRTWTVNKSNRSAHIRILTGNRCAYCLGDGGEFRVEEAYVCKKCIFTIPECKHCGKLLLDGDICSDCKNAFYGHCRDCYKFFLLEDMKDGYCGRCWDKRGYCCDCGEFVRIEYMYKGTDKKLYCRYCFSSKYYTCPDCHKVFLSDDSYGVDRHSSKICKDCFEELYRPCNNCGKAIYLNRLFKKGDQYLCELCHELLKPHIKSYKASIKTVNQTKKILLNMTHKTKERFNYCNVNDDRLLDIRNEVGMATKPIYLYGLINRAEYSFSCSPAMLERLNSYMSEGFIETPNGKERLEIIDIGKPFSLGINMELRLNKFDWVCDFVKKLTNVTC